MKLVPISKVKANPGNPRVIKDHKFQQLKKSLEDFPDMAKVRPIVVNSDMVVLGGNMRLKAMQAAGWKEVPVEVVDWPEERQREFIIKDNVGFGEWDWEILANEWPEVGEWGLDVPGFDDAGEMQDIKEIENFSEKVTFIIECDTIGDLEILKEKLGNDSKKISFSDFILKLGI